MSFEEPFASTRCALTTYDPALVGVPLRVPSAARCSHAGADADHVYGDWPPVATTVARAGMPTSAVLRESFADKGCVTLTVNSRESTRVPVKSFAFPVARTVKVEDT